MIYSMTIRIAFSDPQPLVLEGLGHVFRSQEGFEIVASCRTAAEALRALRQHRPDVLICELRLPDGSGIQVLEEIAAEGLPTRVILLTGAIRFSEMREASRLGVGGVVLKEMPAHTVAQCARKVYAGEPWVENRSAARALQKLFQDESEGGSHLTRREREIALMIGRGLRNKDIAARLSITGNTVKAHLSHIYTKLGVDGRLALLRYVEDKGNF
jgi:DNA-binding NarL/FixJ family response regulator